MPIQGRRRATPETRDPQAPRSNARCVAQTFQRHAVPAHHFNWRANRVRPARFDAAHANTVARLRPATQMRSPGALVENGPNSEPVSAGESTLTSSTGTNACVAAGSSELHEHHRGLFAQSNVAQQFAGLDELRLPEQRAGFASGFPSKSMRAALQGKAASLELRWSEEKCRRTRSFRFTLLPM